MLNFFRGVFGVVFSRYTLALLALLLGALALWFLGPLLSFGGLQPLQGVAMRVTLIIVLLVALLFLVRGWSMWPVAIAAGCLLVWHAGPLLSLGATAPMGPAWVRAAIIGAVLLVCALYGLVRLWRALVADDKLLDRWLHPERNKPQGVAKEELKTLGGIVRQAVDQLKHMRLGAMARGDRSRGTGTGAMRRLFEGKRYLYELPWYLIIGVPGAGKTTALLNSGCKFPIADQMGAASAQVALASDAGTVNSKWWFTNEAVLIDTAGRYTAQRDGVAPSRAGASGATTVAATTATPETTPDSGSTAASESKNAAEWIGYLGLLRKYRTRAPINGVLLTIDVSELIDVPGAHGALQRTTQAAALRARLAELRRELGVRFPVYVIVTKSDLLQGFGDYFSTLTGEGRSQVWGFSLPWVDDAAQRRAGARTSTSDEAVGTGTGAGQSALGAQVGVELGALRQRIDDALPARLQEEFDLDRRKRLYALPQEMAGIAPALTQMLEEVFLDSRFDETQLAHSLRGVYFTSALQGERTVVAAPDALIARLMRALRGPGGREGQAGHATVPGNRSYFIQDVLSRVVFPEAHLVRPNLGWEFRFRVLRTLGHVLSVVIFVALAAALVVSFGNNRRYLADTGNKASALADQVSGLFGKFKMDAVPETLSAAQDVATHRGLDPADPGTGYLYGLYTAAPIFAAASSTYASLEDQMLVPQIARRMENVLSQAIVDADDKTAYETLRAYLMLHDPERYKASDVRAWVVRDWQGPDGARVFGNQSAMLGHLESLFAGDRVVQSPRVQNEALVKRARTFLDSTTSTQRLYERAKAAMVGEAPPDFTLLRVVGSQAGTVFTRASGAPLETGVPGLYTYDGYHELFAKRLPELVSRAQEDDAWVMGQTGPGQGVRAGQVGQAGQTGWATAALGSAQKKTADAASRLIAVTPLMEDIRRQYLTEYAEQWARFLDDVRPVTGNNLAFDLNVLRQFAAPDSPLSRLARAALRETTLSRAIDVIPDDEKSYFDKAAEQLTKQTAKLQTNLGLRAEARLERQLVDNRFAALREVVTGQTEQRSYGGTGSSSSTLGNYSGGARSALSGALSGTGGTATGNTGGARAALEGVTSLLNEFYTVLVVADTAISSNSLPPASNDVGARMRLEGSKLPAPFKEVLIGLANSGATKVTDGAAGILRVQAQAQMDRLLGLMTLEVTEPCRRGIEGRYPFVSVAAGSSVSTAEVNIDDFNAMFATAGAADEYFSKYLAPFVDTSLRPWRYKQPGAGNMMSSAELASATTPMTPATTGPTLMGELLKLLAQRGPNPDAFARAAQIREVFFRDPAAKKMAWKMDVKVLELDPTINELVINFDGQGQRYVHGPIQAIPVSWPGPRGGTVAELTATPRIRPETSSIITSGPWALLRLMERGRITDSATTGRAAVEFQFDGRRAVLDLNTGRLASPLTTDLLRSFKCPGSAA